MAENETSAAAVENNAPAETPEIAPTDIAANESGLTLETLRPKMKLAGKVKKIELFGAFIDVGVGTDGLVHISQLSQEPVNNIHNVIKVDDEVVVWVRKVDAAQGRLDLTMIEMPGLLWNEIRVGQSYSGTIVRLANFGAFIDIGAERPGMIHVSELAGGFVNAPEEVVKVGDVVEAKVIKINPKKKQVDLSMKAMEIPLERIAVDDDEKPLSAFEMALRRAVSTGNGVADFAALDSVVSSMDADKQAKKSRKKEKEQISEKRRKEQDALLNRTLKTQEPIKRG
jgi:small subunit ribosomal protein S1